MSENQGSQDQKSFGASCIKSGFITVGVMLLFLALTYGPMYYRWAYPDFGNIASICSVKFPSNAKLIKRYRTSIPGSQGYYMYVKVEMDKQDVKKFLASAYVSESGYCDDSALVRFEMRRLGGTDVGEWWKPFSAKKFVAIQPYVRLYMLVDLDGPKATAYLMRVN